MDKNAMRHESLSPTKLKTLFSNFKVIQMAKHTYEIFQSVTDCRLSKRQQTFKISHGFLIKNVTAVNF